MLLGKNTHPANTYAGCALIKVTVLVILPNIIKKCTEFCIAVSAKRLLMTQYLSEGTSTLIRRRNSSVACVRKISISTVN